MWRNRILDEAEFMTTRSSGPGGQHVNKSETKVTLTWSLENSALFDDATKHLISERLKGRLTDKGVLQLTCQETRSQVKNRKLVEHRFISLISQSLIRPKKRIPSKRTKSSIERRLNAKKIRGDLKRLRRGGKGQI
jgi:ribosome-associated protein